MSRTNILGIDTRGVDMKSSPLLLGNKKLHAATNVVFEESVVRTRPGFVYESLVANGQFQGACEYRPQEGISATVVSDGEAGIALVVDGVLWFRCNPETEQLYDCLGDVNVFQAENYLILQNENGSTYWWDGETLTESPGLDDGESYDDPEVPLVEITPAELTGDTTLCASETGQDSQITQTFVVIDDANEAPIAGAAVTLRYNGNDAYRGITDSDGRVVFNTTPRAYTYDVSSPSFATKLNENLNIVGIPVERVYEDCADPTVDITGDFEEVVRLIPDISSEAPGVLVLVLDQTGSIGTDGAARGVAIIDQTNVKAVGYLSFGDVICHSRPITTDLATVRAELDFAAANPDSLPFFCDEGGTTPEDGVDALAEGLDLLDNFTELPGETRALFMITDTAGYIWPSADPAQVYARLKLLHAVWLEFDPLNTDVEDFGLYEEDFPETARISHDTFPFAV